MVKKNDKSKMAVAVDADNGMVVAADKLQMVVADDELIMTVAVDKVKIIMMAVSFPLLSTCFRNSINLIRSYNSSWQREMTNGRLQWQFS